MSVKNPKLSVKIKNRQGPVMLNFLNGPVHVGPLMTV